MHRSRDVLCSARQLGGSPDPPTFGLHFCSPSARVFARGSFRCWVAGKWHNRRRYYWHAFPRLHLPARSCPNLCSARASISGTPDAAGAVECAVSSPPGTLLRVPAVRLSVPRSRQVEILAIPETLATNLRPLRPTHRAPRRGTSCAARSLRVPQRRIASHRPPAQLLRGPHFSRRRQPHFTRTDCCRGPHNLGSERAPNRGHDVAAPAAVAALDVRHAMAAATPLLVVRNGVTVRQHLGGEAWRDESLRLPVSRVELDFAHGCRRTTAPDRKPPRYAPGGRAVHSRGLIHYYASGCGGAIHPAQAASKVFHGVPRIALCYSEGMDTTSQQDITSAAAAMGRRGAAARWAKLTPAERTAYARKIASMPRKPMKTKGK